MNTKKKDRKMRNTRRTVEDFISVTEDAYKALVSKDTKGNFEDRNMMQLKLADSEIASKLASYRINLEEKDFRIIKPFFSDVSEKENQVIGQLVLREVHNGVLIWK